MASFGPIANFYDELMHAVPYEMWANYYELLLIQQQVSPKRLLEVCCGTGILCEIFARKGKVMVGFDLSAPMIEQARRKAEEQGLNIRYEVADASSFDLGMKFEAAFSFFDSLNYITDLGKLGSALKRVHDHLLPGGSFVFDLNTAYAFEQKMFDQHDTRKKSRVNYHWYGDYDPKSRIIEVAMEFWYEGKKYTETHVQRAHSHDEIVELLLAAGFDQIRSYDSYTLDPPRGRSDRVHYSAIRP